MVNTRPTDPAKAERAGWTIDRHCYPWVAYQGPRFNPTDWYYLDTPAMKQ